MASANCHDKCMPSNPAQYKKGLERVTTWSNSVINEDFNAVLKDWPDASSLFEHCFISYIKSVRGVNLIFE